MKKTLMNMGIVFALSSSLVGCSTNTQGENTGIGAVTGAIAGGLLGSLVGGGTGQVVAIGVGIVGGALIGGVIGNNMDHTDNTQVNTALDNPTDSSTTWTNRKTGARYTVTPTSGRFTVNGNPNCRRFDTTIVKDGRTKNIESVACQQSDGRWRALK